MDIQAESLRTKILRSTIWTTNSKVVSQVMGFVTTLVLARLLSKDDFGLMAMALSFTGLMDAFIDLGFLAAIVQAKQIHRRQLTSCFWLLVGVSAVVTVGALAAGPLIAAAFAESRVEALVGWLAPLFLLAPFNIIGKGVLSRDLRLDVLAKIELAAGAAKMALSLFLAVNGFGVFSLVYGFVLERVLLTLWVGVAAKWYPTFLFEREGVGPLLAFGSKATGSGLLWYLYTKADVFVIGRVLGAESLGIYTIAGQFPQTLARLVPSTWHRVLFPLFARYQDAPEFKQVLTRSSALLLVVSLPLFCGLAVVAPDVIMILFGPQWQSAVFPMQILAGVAALETVTWTLSAALSAAGRPGVTMLINLGAALVFPVMFYLGAGSWGLAGVLYAAVLAYGYRFLAYLLVTRRVLGLGLMQYAKCHMGAVLAATAMGLGVAALTHGGADWNAYVRLSTGIGVGAAIYLGVLVLVDREQIEQFKAYVRTA